MTENEQKKTGEELDDQKYILVSDDSWFEIEEEFWAANAMMLKPGKLSLKKNMGLRLFFIRRCNTNEFICRVCYFCCCNGTGSNLVIF